MFSSKNIFLVISLICSAAVYALTTFFAPDFSEGFHSTDYIKEFSTSICDAHFPVYWLKNIPDSFGSPLPTIIPPLPALLISPLVILGLSPNLAMSLYIMAIFMVTSLSWFYLGDQKLSPSRSLLFTLFILTLQSVILSKQTYLSLTLFTFVSILPIFLQTLIKKSSSLSYVAKLSLISSILILTNFTIFASFTGFFLLISYFKGTLTNFFKSLTLAFLATSFFCIPFILEVGHIGAIVSSQKNKLPSNFYQIEGDSSVVEEVNKTGEKYVQLNHNSPLVFTYNSMYYPGWKFYLNDVLISPDVTANSVPTIKISPEGGEQKNVKLIFENTPIKNITIIISLIATVCLLFVFIYGHTNKNISKSFGLVALIIFIFNITLAILGSENKYQKFDPEFWQKRYLESQWVNPQSKHPIGDHGLYAWAGWAYFHGENPILINSEMPPLGKYIIGLLLTLTRSAFATGLFISAFMFTSLYLLSRKIFTNVWLAFVPLSLLSFERIVTSSLTLTMLDGLLVGFLALYFYFLVGAKSWKSFILASLILGGVLTSKFYATGVLVAASSVFYYTLTTNWSKLFKYLLTLPIAGLVHLISYTRYFILGGSLWGYLGIQKYIFTFYSQGGPRVPFGSYWLLVFFNRWRVWWGPVWGEFYTLTTKEWRPTWPMGAVTSLLAIFILIKRSLAKFKNKIKSVPDFFLIVSWLLAYSTFLSLIGGWPHYMMMFLPFSSIITVKLIIDYNIHIRKLTAPFMTQLKKFK